MSDTKKTAFFSNNFAEDSWKNKAQKNAFVLLGKQRFEEAAAFFLLADKLWDAVEVCMSNLDDYQLAFVIIRLYEGDHGPVYQRFLKECILGVRSSSFSSSSDRKGSGFRLELSPDPFLRSIVYWLLQDCSDALETLLVSSEGGEGEGEGGGKESAGYVSRAFHTNPAIFNFYFYLRTHPFLVRRDNASASSFLATPSSLSAHRPALSGKGLLSSVGDEPLTAVERSLVFSTAYYHLSHGCPLLALNVLSRLPNSGKLGRDLSDAAAGGVAEGRGISTPHQGPVSMAGMIESGTLSGSFVAKENSAESEEKEDEDFDWGAPVSTQHGGHRYGDVEEEEFDWSKPLVPNGSGHFSGSEEIDWSQPFSSSRRFSLDMSTLSPPDLNSVSTLEEESIQPAKPTSSPSPPSSSSFSARGLFVLTLAEQLQYNACLSIVTEELHGIYLPACCHFLWSSRGRAGLPILPLPKQSVDSDLSLVQHYGRNAFDRTVQNLRGMLTQWLRGETEIVKEVCWMESLEGREEGGGAREKEEKGAKSAWRTEEEEASTVGAAEVAVVGVATAPAGYDILTTLMNYASLHAATSPSLLTVQFELMHLMNTLLPWSSSSHHAPSLRPPPDTSLELVPTCAVDPSQLPVLTSCSLPVRHLTNLASHLRLLSGCVVEALTKHMYPPISSQPLPQVGKIYELCCALSHCITVSLNPVLHTDLSPPAQPHPHPDTPIQSRVATLTGSMGSLGGHTPTSSDTHLRERDASALTTIPGHSPLLRQRLDSFNNLDSTLGTPNTKPSKWPGVSGWPQNLTSDEGRDPTPLSVVLVECVVSVYLGLFATAWSRHAVKDLLVLLKNGPAMEMWYSCVGGGVDAKLRGTDRTLSRNFVSQTLENMSRRFRRGGSSGTAKQTSTSPGPTSPTLEEVGVFVAPKRTLLDHFLSPRLGEEQRTRTGVREKVTRGESGGFLMVEEEEEEETTTDEEGKGWVCQPQLQPWVHHQVS